MTGIIGSSNVAGAYSIGIMPMKNADLKTLPNWYERLKESIMRLVETSNSKDASMALTEPNGTHRPNAVIVYSVMGRYVRTGLTE